MMLLERLKLEARTALMFWAVFAFAGAATSAAVALWFYDFDGIWQAWLRGFSTPQLELTGLVAIALTAAISLLDQPAGTRNPSEPR
jgi:hypothetical protein